ncbi:MAG: hypothetical protein Q7R49_01710 [Candidatus Daviesbacteria bacterium]|nr:hypothetical protein [Candidatus Daviesbacteria bacterium]
MILDTLSRTNIHDLNLEAPQKPEPTRLDKVLGSLTDRELENINSAITGNDAEYILYLKFLAPRQAKHFLTSESYWAHTKERVGSAKDKDVYRSYPWLAGYARLVFPEKAKELRIDDETWKKILDKYLQSDGRVNSIGLSTIYYMYLSDSSRASSLHLVEKRNDFKGFALNHREPGARLWDAAYKIMYPEDYKEIKLTPDEINEEYKQLNVYKEQFSWNLFLSEAFNLKILEADSVRVTEKGLEITDKVPEGNFAPVVPSLPEMRKF